MSQYKCKCPNCLAENIVNDAQLAKQCEQCGRIIILEDYTLTDSEKDQKIDYAYQLLAKSSLSTIQEAQGYLDQFTDEEIGKDLRISFAWILWPLKIAEFDEDESFGDTSHLVDVAMLLTYKFLDIMERQNTDEQYKEIVRFLAEYRSIEKRISMLHFVSIWACGYDKSRLSVAIDKFIEYGADVNATASVYKNRIDVTPLDVMYNMSKNLKNGDVSVCACLEKHGAVFKGTTEKINYNDKTSGGGCYIATAVYGNYNAPEVITLRKFRDDVLLENYFGRIFVKVYYCLSPRFAKWLKNKKLINDFVRKCLDCFVHKLDR
ncbi:MAG: CFI-box-CTERM domain-containing protein [Eubacterium sp.]|nr:CFI-box-CTERM domain-containing protein [Eubacterium sp.]